MLVAAGQLLAFMYVRTYSLAGGWCLLAVGFLALTHLIVATKKTRRDFGFNKIPNLFACSKAVHVLSNKMPTKTLFPNHRIFKPNMQDSNGQGSNDFLYLSWFNTRTKKTILCLLGQLHHCCIVERTNQMHREVIQMVSVCFSINEVMTT